MAVELLGVPATTFLPFVGFGLVIGLLFGFFGMGGSFLVTPALLVMGYPAEVAVGSGLAFVFGTSVIAALRHRDHGQVDVKLGALFVVGMTAGIEVGKSFVYSLKAMGVADFVVSVAYVVMLSGVGLFMLYDSRTPDSDGPSRVVELMQSLDLPPTVSIKGGAEVSVWLTLAIAAVIGVLAGFLGVGGGFLLMPAMMYVLGVPAAVAVGTDVFQITVSGAVGAFFYAQEGAVDLAIVAPLLAGSALGARVGAAATKVVDSDDITGYFSAMLLAGAAAVASKNLGAAFAVPALRTLSKVLIFGAAVVVAAAVLYRSVVTLREDPSAAPSGS